MQTPLVSIIIPTYNRAHLIGETLGSVMAQTYTNWECIVVDDGSTDTTDEVLKMYCDKDNRIKYYHRPEDRLSGGNAARNYGFELSKGEYIQWFDSDDIMNEGLIELQLLNIFKNGKKISICLYDRYDEKLIYLNKKAIPHSIKYGVYFDYIVRDLEANLPTILFKKEILKNFKLSETLFKAQEYEFLQSVFKIFESECIFLNKVLIKVRRHKDSITETLDDKKMDSALKAILLTYNNLPDIAPRNIKFKLTKHYLKVLYISFSNKKRNIFYKYLLKLVSFQLFRGILTIIFLGLLYPITNMFKIGTWHYKKIYILYG